MSHTQTSLPRLDAEDKPYGPALYKMCDRSKQVTQFLQFFRTSLSTHKGLPQVYLLHGEYGQSHSNLIYRLMVDKIAPYASSTIGISEGIVYPIKTWLQAMDDLEGAKKSIKFSLFEAVSPAYDAARLSARDFCAHSKLKHFPFVVIQHDFDLEDWVHGLPELVEWYLNTYWASIGTLQNQVLLFLNFIYPDLSGSLWRRFSPANHAARRRFGQFLRALSEEVNATYPCLLIDELSHLNQKEVCRSLVELGINEDEDCPGWMNNLFKQKRGRVKMVDVEKLIRLQLRSPGLYR